MNGTKAAMVLIDAILALASLSPHIEAAAKKLRELFSRAEAEGRDLTREEVLALRADADVADALWEAALARAKKNG